MKRLFYVLVMTVAFAGCAVEQEYSRTPRTAVEQLLLTQAIERSFHNLRLELPPGATLELQATSLDSDRTLVRITGPELASAKHPALETTYIRDAVAAVLGRHGYRIPNQDTNYLVRVMVESLGTMQGLTLIGLPPIQSTVIPFSLPELALFKFQKQSRYARLHVNMFDNRTGDSSVRPRRSSDGRIMISIRCCFISPGPQRICSLHHEAQERKGRPLWLTAMSVA
ncbi:MAG TPA: hypothetical protein VFH05_09130 [Nitrospira sp.]|nr:hypothetical protein [Nitrospira sp.]